MLWFLNLQRCMFEMVWFKILALEVYLETPRSLPHPLLPQKTTNKPNPHNTKLKVGEDYFQEESLNFAKLVEPIPQEKNVVLNGAVNAAYY